MNGLAKGSDALRLAPVRSEDARTTLAEIGKRFGAYQAGISSILSNMANLVVAKQAARSVNNEAEPLLTDTTTLADQYQNGNRTRAFTLGLSIAFALLALGCLAMVAKVFLNDARLRAQDSEHENKRNQEAILRLLNEMGNLADGDLTVQASVTEDVTGAIADSINFTIEELRTLVRGINSATDQVTKATQETQAISNRLFEASQRQNREIQQASASVLHDGASRSTRWRRTPRSRRRSRKQSLAAAEKGGSAVQNQISGMNDIRSQIQETSKRIKRLGESSLEIGEIVELISDITEQTNVLALNAAIQAASAGEAGRGFSVVAEEVQRLAERSGEATKQIEAIVKTIQADTQDAVAAMEKSTVGVVEGAKLSDAAGQALAEIQQVSRELAELIGSISAQTQTPVVVGHRRHARHAGHPEDLRGNDRRHEADERVDRPVDEACRRTAQFRGRLQGLSVDQMHRRPGSACVLSETATEFDLGPLSWVQGEIDEALTRGTDALAAFRGQPWRHCFAQARARARAPGGGRHPDGRPRRRRRVHRRDRAPARAARGTVRRGRAGCRGSRRSRGQPPARVPRRDRQRCTAGAADAVRRIRARCRRRAASTRPRRPTCSIPISTSARRAAPQSEIIPAARLASHLLKERRQYQRGLLEWLRGADSGAGDDARGDRRPSRT